MKSIIRIFLGIGLILVWSCGDDEVAPEFCTDDHAEYLLNDNVFQTAYEPDGGEILTANGDNCGISAVLDENINLITLRIFGENQDLSIRADISNLNEMIEISFGRFIISSNDSPFDLLSSDHPNYLLIEELNSTDQTMNGTFGLQLENASGDKMNISEGTFTCSYQAF